MKISLLFIITITYYRTIPFLSNYVTEKLHQVTKHGLGHGESKNSKLLETDQETFTIKMRYFPLYRATLSLILHTYPYIYIYIILPKIVPSFCFLNNNISRASFVSTSQKSAAASVWPRWKQEPCPPLSPRSTGGRTIPGGPLTFALRRKSGRRHRWPPSTLPPFATVATVPPRPPHRFCHRYLPLPLPLGRPWLRKSACIALGKASTAPSFAAVSTIEGPR